MLKHCMQLFASQDRMYEWVVRYKITILKPVGLLSPTLFCNLLSLDENFISTSPLIQSPSDAPYEPLCYTTAVASHHPGMVNNLVFQIALINVKIVAKKQKSHLNRGSMVITSN